VPAWRRGRPDVAGVGAGVAWVVLRKRAAFRSIPSVGIDVLAPIANTGRSGRSECTFQAFCAKHGIPLIEAQARDRKHELAQPYLPNDPNFSGLFLVIKGNAPAPIWEVKRNGDGQITEIRHRKSWPYVRHFYFHLIDREWGHVTIRICSYPPFGAQVILNGHERVERQARRKSVTVVKDGNCFIEGSDFSAISRLGAQFTENLR